MSVIVGIKYKNGVLLGGDTQATEYGHLAENVNSKIFKSKYSNTAIGGVGYLRDLNLIEIQEEWIEYKDILDKTNINKKYIITNIIPKIFNLFRDNHRLYNKDNIEYIESDFLFVTSKGIFCISEDGSVIEKNNYATIGCGSELVKGFLENNSKWNDELTYEEAKNLIELSIKKSCEKDIYINEEITYIDIRKEVNKNGNE